MTDEKILNYIISYIESKIQELMRDTLFLTEIEKDNRLIGYNDILKRIYTLKNKSNA